MRLVSGAVGGLDALAAAHQVDSPESFIRCDNLPKRFLLLKRRAVLVLFAKSFGTTRGRRHYASPTTYTDVEAPTHD